MALGPGDTIDRYRIIAPLGAGGMGEVYRAHDARLQRDVALKILHPGEPGSRDSDAVAGSARMLREARAAAALEHPNVIAVYDVGEVIEPVELRGTAYIAMELIKGKALRAFIGVPTPFAERVRWLVDIARALGAAHDAGMVHRDVKPENVMIRDDGVVKVLDFGIAKRTVSTAPVDPTQSTEAHVVPQATTRGLVVGTPYYMAPEQMRNEQLDGRADQFAWGVVAYELLAGKPPWTANTDTLQLVSEILSANPTPPSAENAEIPPRVEQVILRALSKVRTQRFASMGEVVAALVGTSVAADPTMFAPTESHIPIGPASASGSKRLLSDRRVVISGSVLPEVQRRGPARWIAAAAALAALVGIGALYRRAHEPGAAATTPSASAVAPTNEGFPSFGSPMSKVPAAAEAYRKGMLAVRDADTEGAESELDRAVELDPSFAAADLRRALIRIPLGHVEQQRARDAVGSRAALGPHDRILLDAIAPLLEVPGNLVEAGKRLEEAFARAPADADFALHLCRTERATGDIDKARVTCARAVALDPEGAAPIRENALVQMHLDDVAGALTSFETCLRLSPLATSCLDPLWQLQASEGKCADALGVARRLVASHPDSKVVYDHLAVALTGAGEPLESVRLALDSKLEHTPAADVPVTRLRDAAHLAILTGDFSGARKELRAWDDAVAQSREEFDHLVVTYDRVQLAEEEGKRAEAASIANAFLARRPAWKISPDGDYSFYLVGQLYALGALGRADFVAKRAAWLASQKATHASEAIYLWIDAYANAAVTAADAREALEALPEYLPLPDPLDRQPETDGPIGRVYRLAGRESEAIPFLSRAAKACLPLAAPFEQTWASLDLGLALEKLNRVPEACDAYRGVLARWRSAPTSLSARQAADRARALGCPP